ncbi:hypothetical protein JB92DRAFT_2936183 [Gautieria morchelliformis]|nr:hypothetical protein JB92DRAFT_2936183 [Gautieria morchelliformis]
MSVFLTSCVLARVSGSSGEDKWDPKVPLEKQIVTYQAKDAHGRPGAYTRSTEGARESIGRPQNHR